MSQNTSAALLEPRFVTRVANPVAALAVRRTKQTAERIWHNAHSIVEGTLHKAESLLEADGKNATPEAIADLAYTLHLSQLDKAAAPNRAGESVIDSWNTVTILANRIALLMLEMPLAGRTQRELNATDWHHGTRDEHKIAILSAFNDDLAGTLAHLPPSMMADFPERLLQRSQTSLQQPWNIETMRAEDLYRSLRGVTREVAFWRALHAHLPHGWAVRQSTVTEDVHGTDFVITTPDGREMRVDVKARERFDVVVDKLLVGRWISRADADAAHQNGFVYNPNTNQQGARDGTFTMIFDADMLGQIDNYDYADPSRAVRFVTERIKDQKATTRRRQLGQYALRPAS